MAQAKPALESIDAGGWRERLSNCASAGIISYCLRYRDLVAMMSGRGLHMSHATILRWVVHYVPEFEKR